MKPCRRGLAKEPIQIGRTPRFTLTAPYLAAVLVAVVCVFPGGAWAADPKVYKPPQFVNAENHVQVKFLPDGRDVERIDIYVPKLEKERSLPCVVFFYGGGWGSKVSWRKENVETLLNHGYVVAQPDYVLGGGALMAVWDGASAIRFLRANAGKYRIDPERIAGVGLSAGGWLLQELAPADSASLWKQEIRGATTGPQFFPVIEPHPANAEFSAQVCALVSDWGAARLCRVQAGLGPNDPPLFTCAVSETKASKGIKAYRDAGAIVELGVLVTDKQGQALDGATFKFNPDDFGHGLVGVAPFGRSFRAKGKAGQDMDFGDRTLQFLDEYVKNPTTASSPELFPQGGPVHGATAVTLRSVHADAKIYYTVDGSEPTERSPVYARPLAVTGGVTMKALTVKPALKPSPVTTAVFTSASCAPPVITTVEPVYRAKVNQPFAVTLQAKSERPVAWYLCGKIKAEPLEKVDPNKDNSGITRESPWLTLDPQTGLLSGTPKAPGVNVLIVSANVKDGKMVLCDARSVIVVAE